MLQNVDFLKFLIYTLFEVEIMDNIFLNNCFKIISYKKNEMIVNEGDICINIGFLLEGSLSVSNTLPDFNESIIQVLNKGDVFGENLIFSDNPYYPGNIYANNNCQIAFISKNNFLNLLSSNTIFRDYYITLLSKKFISMQERIKVLSQNSLYNKVLFYFEMISQKTHSKSIKIKSIDYISKYLNVPRPSVSRVISKLNEDKKIIKNKKIITLI